MTQLAAKPLQWRIVAVMLALVCAALMLIGRIVFLQVLNVEKGYQFLQDEGAERAIRVIASDAPRGTIIDRNGNELAVSTPVVTVGVNPAVLLSDPQGMSRMAAALNEDVDVFRARLQKKSDKQFVYLKRNLSPSEADDLLVIGAKGVRAEPGYRRYYPAGEIVSHVVGFSDVDDNGQEGVELAFNHYLQPIQGRKRILQDLFGNTVRELEILSDATAGRELGLSIDLRIQYAAYTALAKAVKSTQAQSGSMVLVDSHSGEILALANYPSYNPNNRGSLRYEFVRNRAVTDSMEPGSVVKPFAMLAALEAGTVTPTSIIDTAPGYLRVDGKMLKDSRNNGELSVAQILAKSSQIGITKIALNTDPGDVRSVYELLGVGAAVGTGFPGEALGSLPSYKSWRDIDRATMAFGHGVSMSVLQLAQAYQVIANDGVKVPLTLLKRSEPELAAQVVSSESTRAIVDMLSGTLERGGTASSSAVAGYEFSGKTGTAHKVGASGYLLDKYRALFAGIAPRKSPRFVAVVMIDEPKGDRYYGGEVAAPVFSEVAASVLPYLGVVPDINDARVAHIDIKRGLRS